MCAVIAVTENTTEVKVMLVQNISFKSCYFLFFVLLHLVIKMI